MNVRFDLDNPMMRAILGIAEYFLDNRRNKIRSRAVVFPSSEPREFNDKKEENGLGLGRRASLGRLFCRSPVRVPSIYCDSTLKRKIRDSSQSGRKSKFYL